ncbi:hypothetical protein BCV70DRAFT_197552 [Testicularia cyperi]|uniref:RNA polymerase II assembly factor Rtp1 C-terminal domain-containing protein n=1 Tax=Testicularia cyperi TaxID=1882483 RepID=A0A317XYI8_9BASI|nr:hypothetical protein BCV70DRAFT_197552 [Testicularia cyperi]
MTDTTAKMGAITTGGPSLDPSYRQRLSDGLRASRILTGLMDEELGIQKATIKTKLGAKNEAETTATLHATLSTRLQHALETLGERAPVSLSQDDTELATGDLALSLLSDLHSSLLDKQHDGASRVSVREHSLRPAQQRAEPKEDVGLGIKDVKLVGTLHSLATRWALSTRTKQYDEALASLNPKLFTKPRDRVLSRSSYEPSCRFQEIAEEDPQERMRARQTFDTRRISLAAVLHMWSNILVLPPTSSTSDTDRGSVAATTDVATVLLRVGIVDYLASLLRLGFGPGSMPQPGRPPGYRDTHQVRAMQLTTQLLKFLSASSAMSALSSVSSYSDSSPGIPIFVRAMTNRLLAAQLLRPDGVRSLLMITFGNADPDGTIGSDNNEAQPGQGSGSLKKFQQSAQLLMTPPQGMPIDLYLPIILPNLIDVLAPDPDTTATTPPQDLMRAAGFALTRISEQHAEAFQQALDQKVFAAFRPSSQPKETNHTQDMERGGPVTVDAKKLDRALSTLSSFLLFSEPSPTLYCALFEPILPQLITLHDYLGQAKPGGKGKMRSDASASVLDRVKDEVEGILKTYIRLVDAEHGSRAVVDAIQAAEFGIGWHVPEDMAKDYNEEKSFFWSEDEDAFGPCIRYGVPQRSAGVDLVSIFNDLTFSTLAKQISAGRGLENTDIPELPDDLANSLGLQPDPRLVVALLKEAGRKDLARLVLPRVLDAYMANKLGSRAKMLSERQQSTTESRSVLYLQLILQLFDAFGSEMLQGDTATTLAFIDFSLSAPGARHRTPQSTQKGNQQNMNKEVYPADDIPFISSRNKPDTSNSLFNIAKPVPVSAVGDADYEDETDVQESEREEASEANQDDMELVSTALTLLLSLLEGDSGLSGESEPMLVVIAAKIDHFLENEDEEIRSLSREAKLVLTARKNAVRGPEISASTSTDKSDISNKALGFAKAHETYQEALRLLQDPIMPVRAHGLVLLRKLVSDNKKEGGQAEHVDPALLPAILDIFLQTVQDDESYLYLNAVQGLGALASSGGKETISRLVGVYIGRDDQLASVKMSSREVEKRLRVGEALLQVIQRCSEALGPHVSILVSPILARLRDRALPTVLRSSFLSILGTAVEAVPLAIISAGYARDLAEVCMDIVAIETVQRPEAKREAVTMKVQGQTQDVSDEAADAKRAEEQRKLDSATVTDPKVAHLRRAALLLLVLLVRGARHQLQDAMSVETDGSLAPVEKLTSLRLPGGGMLPRLVETIEDGVGSNTSRHEKRIKDADLLFPLDRMQRLKQLASYVQARDTDSIVRLQAHDCVKEVEELAMKAVAAGLQRL